MTEPESAPPRSEAESLYFNLKARQEKQRHPEGKLIVTGAEARWETSLQGRNALLIDRELTGIDSRSFGLLLTELPAGRMSGLHYHSFEAAMYVLEGVGYELIGDRVVAWRSGDTVFMPANVPHRHVNASRDARARFLQIETWPLLESLNALELVQLEDAGDAPAELLDRLAKECENDPHHG